MLGDQRRDRRVLVLLELALAGLELGLGRAARLLGRARVRRREPFDLAPRGLLELRDRALFALLERCDLAPLALLEALDLSGVHGADRLHRLVVLALEGLDGLLVLAPGDRELLLLFAGAALDVGGVRGGRVGDRALPLLPLLFDRGLEQLPALRLGRGDRVRPLLARLAERVGVRLLPGHELLPRAREVLVTLGELGADLLAARLEVVGALGRELAIGAERVDLRRRNRPWRARARGACRPGRPSRARR